MDICEVKWFAVWRERSGLIPPHMNYNTGDGEDRGHQWTPSQLSHAVQEVGKRLFILCLCGKGATVNGARVVCLGGRGGHIVPTLSVDLIDVGVVCHVDIIGMGGDRSGQLVDSLPTVHSRPPS